MTYHPHTPAAAEPAAPTPVPPHIPHQRIAPETLDAARADYEAGLSAPVVAERYGIGERHVRRMARSQGWQRPAVQAPPTGGVGLQEMRARLEVMIAGQPENLMDRRDADPELDKVVNAHALEVGRLLMRPTPLDLSRFAFRRAAEAAARGASNEATGWVRLVNAIDRSRPTLELTAHPGNGDDMNRAALANMLRQLQQGENPEIGPALEAAGGEAWMAAEDQIDEEKRVR